ncbi:hypothetical protein [Methylobacterium iners]|uniref:Uncharacterized protein n=1 Tax=Methylobacterium iners TaxID=418707 RepID=A0ABQ4RQ51_9HYPH|nr:hypothetical protein [Methylobacterium iners]GJD92886.1 hypothetical protein OCOJLMKI_0069 [Methylobacterium iners]
MRQHLALAPYPNRDMLDLVIDGMRAGLVYREPETGEWCVALSHGSPGSLWFRWADVPTPLREAASEWHASLADLIAALSINAREVTTPRLQSAA